MAAGLAALSRSEPRRLSPPRPPRPSGTLSKGVQVSRPRILAIVVIVAEYRDPPSSTFPAAPAIDTTGESAEETRPVARPLAKVLPFAARLKRIA